ncbi:PREDICTED: cytochrome P450 9e2-like [Atta cephalotes]|uniref:Cytochrome P450 n=1 Tax=Atta cephalotes TaxID=12957 RepID=A0A158NEY3_ATTCE|nr:PREDICTED: cytochrome P450 9e2-like [Atta cephalotes]
MSLLFRQMTFFYFMLKIYNFNPDTKYYGLYITTTPVFLLRDLELIKTVLVKNFDAFPNRFGFADVIDSLLKKTLFSLRGEKWRNVKNLLNPSFISSKMKIMFASMMRNVLWISNDIIHLPPLPLFGSTISMVFRRISFFDFMLKIYNCYPNAKYFGFYFTTTPVFLLRDLELIKSVLVKNFDAFPDRRGFADFNDPLFEKNLFSLHGEKWRNVRNLLSPSFISSKMKMMFTLMSECAVNFAKFLSTLSADKGGINMKDVCSKYTTDVIATCAFGIKVNSMKDPTNKFYIYGKEASNFTGVLRDKEGRRELDMTAQAFIFFLGGFETTSTAMCFAAHEIAANPEIQTNLQQEIDKVLEESNGEVSYETINRLEYLDAVICETLRLYPPVAILERLCEKTFELPPALPDEKSFIMKKGMLIWIPVLAIHNDEKYYDNPKKFDSERFLNNKMNNSSNYMPFGLGPRMCIANRFAILKVKVLLFHLLAQCELKPCVKTMSPYINKYRIKFCKDSLPRLPENGFWLNIQRRKNIHSIQASTIMDS